MPNSRSFISRVDILKRYHWHNAYLPSVRNLSVPIIPTVATSLNNLALRYTKPRVATPTPSRCTSDRWRSHEKALGPDHPDVATSLNNLAELYQAQGRYADAEPLYKRALAIHEKALGPDHPDVATSLNNLAVLYQAQGRYADAEPLYKRSLAIREKALGPDHPDVAAIAEQSGWDFTKPKVATPMPSRSTSDRWRSARKRLVPIIPMLRHR